MLEKVARGSRVLVYHFIGNWKYISCAVGPLILLAVLFAIPLKSIATPVIESYWDAELKKQSYTVSESYDVMEPSVAEQTRSETVYDSRLSSADSSFSFKLKNPDTTVDIAWEGLYSSYPRSLYWYPYGNTSPDFSPRFFPPDYYWYGGSTTRLQVKITYPESITTYNKVTRQRDVTREVEVPTPVLKTRVVTKYERISIWSYLFRQ